MYRKKLNVVLSVILLIIICISIKFLTDNVEETVASESCITVVIDPGHGGVDPGKVGVNGELEKEINLSIANELGKYLRDQGINVIFTRENDDGLYSESDTNKKASDMKKRCKIINDANPVVAVSIHQNSFTDSEVSGAQVFYYTHSDNGKMLAQCIQNQLSQISNEDNDRQIKANDKYFMLTNTICPIVIVECGFLSNYEEARKLSEESYQKQLAEAIMTGILDFLKNND